MFRGLSNIYDEAAFKNSLQLFSFSLTNLKFENFSTREDKFDLRYFENVNFGVVLADAGESD